MRHALTFIIAGAVLGGMLMAQNDEGPVSEPKAYDNAKVVRIKAVEGEAFVERSYEEGSEEATADLPLFENDKIATTEGRVEIYLGRTNHLRLDNDTRIQLIKVPALRSTDLTLKIERGGVYLDVAGLDNEKAMEIQTPDCGIFLLDQGVYRINVMDRGRTEILVLEGLAEVSGQDSSRNLRENQKMVMSGGTMVERPYYFYASDRDDFDEWNQERARIAGNARYASTRYLESGYEDYEYELTRSGRWTYMNDFRCHVWIPYNLQAGWRPYWNGRWIWNPYYGYVWTSYDPCGWFTHHYGRWHWDDFNGWYWIPAYHWSGAWVNWFWDNDYYGWCPLSWWNRPVVVIGNRWDHHYDHRHGLPLRSRSTIVIRKGELAAPNMSRAAITREGLAQDDGRRVAFRGEAPTIRPESAKVAVIDRNGEHVALKRSGIISMDHYQATDNAGASAREGGATLRSRSNIGGKYSSGDSTGTVARGRYRSGGSEENASGGEGKTVIRSSTFRDREDRRGSQGGAAGTTSGNSGSGARAKKKDKGGEGIAWEPAGNETTDPASSSSSQGYRSYRGKYSGGGAYAKESDSSSYQGYHPATRYPRQATGSDDGNDGDIMPPYSFSRRSAYGKGTSGDDASSTSEWRKADRPVVSDYGYRRDSGGNSSGNSGGYAGRTRSSSSGGSVVARYHSGGSTSSGSYSGGGSSRGSVSVSRGSSGSHSSGGSSGGSARKRD